MPIRIDFSTEQALGACYAASFIQPGSARQGLHCGRTLDKQANVQLMSTSEYRSYKSVHRYRYSGGLAKKSPVRLAVQSKGQ